MTVHDIKKYLPPDWLNTTGKNIPAIINAINANVQELEELAQACIDQLFLQTATGRFLIQLGEQEGFTMPANSGLDIRAYRALVPIMVSNPKQVRNTLDDLIKAFYLGERTRAGFVSALPGPYSLVNGDNIIFETESGLVTISVLSGQVADLTQVTPAEIAAVINSNQSLVLADEFVDKSTSQYFLRITSNTSGSVSKIRIAGGSLQNLLKFPTISDTNILAGSVWNITKTSVLSDVTTFTWNGVGTNPEVFKSRAGDLLTIRGLTDGAFNFSLLNGSYQLVDVGYDYFVIRNDAFDYLSASLTVANNNLVITSQEFALIYDRDEFAFTSETDDSTITLTVPAVPPLGRRFLVGSAHLHGAESQVLDFTRNTIKIQLGTDADKPDGVNRFVLKNSFFRYDFRKPYYGTTLVDSSLTQPTYTLETGDPSLSILPYTTATVVGTDPIFCNVDSSDFILTFPNYSHGLDNFWGFTLSGAVSSGNILNTDLNKEQFVVKVLNKNEVLFRIKDSSGVDKVYSGVAFGPVTVEQYSAFQANGADFFMDFATPAEAAVFVEGMLFRFNTFGGTDVSAYLAQQLRFRLLEVKGVSGVRVDFSAGLGVGPSGTIITAVSGRRSASFGGTISYFLNKTSTHNAERVFSGLTATMLHSQISSNPEYVGPYIYDPDGEQATVTVSKIAVSTTQTILQGDNLSTLLVNSTVASDGTELPQTGNIVIDYGKDTFEGPIRFFAVIENPGSNQILIDPAYKFKFSHSIGSVVQYIHTNSPYAPGVDGSAYPFYITGTAEARNTLFELAELLVAAGIFIEEDVLLPALRYDDTAIEPFS